MKHNIYVLKMIVIFSLLSLSTTFAQSDKESREIWSVVKVNPDFKKEIQRNCLTLNQIPLNQCLQKIVKSAIFCGLGETKEIYHRA